MEMPIRTLQEMPEIYGQADKDWIIQQLERLTPAVRQKAVLRYAAVYQEAFDTEPVSFRKENRARHEANTRLRLFVRNHGRALQGYTAEPPLAGTPPRS
ncbi:hypothetical protein ZD92_21280 [Salmonella enterica subsp. enterica]|nr:hypothetical protein [Salmonella enterica]ECC3377801.1 hypothetical protein [Salmonella enterica subsp. enterica]EDQ4123332.1 hypothetical protein [Salmonella enterica subsp. enterica serovar Sandiego]EDR7166125.1 hypothetical protein [Salmonella enterica subsp. houtenae]EHG5810207.1 hypothetical protein [Salmonella enterica subsp. enterica serovar Nottingham]